MHASAVVPSLHGRLSLPYEMWIQIGHCIPPLELEDLFSVNSALFHLAMTQRYSQVSFAYLSPRMIRLLCRLKDPNVAKRVRILHMHPYFIKELVDTESAQTPSDSLFSLFSKHRRIFHRTKSRKPRVYTVDEIVLMLGDVLSGLTNLSEYHIAWVGLPSTPTPFICTPFVHSPITRLSLEMTLENLSTLLRQRCHCLTNLRDLDLFLRTEHTLDATGYDMILAKVLAPLINKHDLHSLTLRLWEPLDVSPLFSSLKRLPNLKSLSITIPLTAPHLGHPDSLTDFINMHTHTLQHLSLRATDLSSPVLGMDGASLAQWIQTAFYAVRVDALRTFELGMGLIPYESAILCVSRFAGRLERLTLTGRPLCLDEISRLVDAAGSNLRRLRIGPVILSPQMVDVLSRSTPSLDRLEIVVSDVVPHEGDLPIPDEAHGYGGQDESQVGKFLEEMGRRCYMLWRLRVLEFVKGSCPYQREMRLLWKSCIPALQEVLI